MTFQKGWKLRRDAALGRAAQSKEHSSAYRIYSTRERDIEKVGLALVTLVERHGALEAELSELSKRIAVAEYNAAAGQTDSDRVMRYRARIAVLPDLIASAAAAVAIEKVRVEAERAVIRARHAAEDAAAVMAPDEPQPASIPAATKRKVRP